MEKQGTEEQVILFILKGYKYGIGIKNLVEVCEVGELKKVGAEGIYAGKVVVRSREVPVINLNMLLQLGEGEFTENVRVLVLESSSKIIGLMVDEVLGVIPYQLKIVRPLPKLIMDDTIGYFMGVGRLNEELILFLKDSELIASTLHGKF